MAVELFIGLLLMSSGLRVMCPMLIILFIKPILFQSNVEINSVGSFSSNWMLYRILRDFEGTISFSEKFSWVRIC